MKCKKKLNREKLVSYIQLINTSGVGPINFRKALARFGDVDKILEWLSSKQKIYLKAKAEEEVMTAELKNVKIITAEDELYPYNLKQIEDYPPILYALGNVNLLKNVNAIAIVGSRNASISAQRLASKLAEDLANKGIMIVSGMARGIDAAAHEGAQRANGQTIAVLGTGIDVVYPKENEKLYHSLIEQGLVISEYPFHTKPLASNFPRRNRIVSGLSKGTLVIEAGIKSGSLITAHQALDQGRDVFAVPGSPYDTKSSGCNQLLREGAILVESAEDILENFTFTQVKFTSGSTKTKKTPDLFEYSLDNNKNNSDISGNKDDDYTKLLSLISVTGEDIDDLIRVSKLSAEKVLMMIVEMELDDRVVRLPGNKIARI